MTRRGDNAGGPAIGYSFSTRIPDGDTAPRAVCDHCGFIHYVNPKIVVGSVATWAGRILMCRRAIEPRRGFWTLPAGYMELHETTEDAARREAREEACADIRIGPLLAIYNIPRISQVQLIYCAALVSPDVRPGLESTDVALLDIADIPWDALAFPSVHWALRHFLSLRGRDALAPFTNPEGASGDAMPEIPPGD